MKILNNWLFRSALVAVVSSFVVSVLYNREIERNYDTIIQISALNFELWHRIEVLEETVGRQKMDLEWYRNLKEISDGLSSGSKAKDQ